MDATGDVRNSDTARHSVSDFDWLCFNMNLAADRFQYGMKRLAIAIDPSYVSKAGKKDRPCRSVLVWMCFGCEAWT